MIKYILKRLGYGVLVIIGLITIVFFLFNVLPADPARMMLGQRADVASLEAINKDLGLDQPVAKRYLNYLNDISPVSYHNHSDQSSYWYYDTEKYGKQRNVFKTKKQCLVIKAPYLGRSYQSKRKVGEILSEAFPKTLLLASVSILFAVIFGVLIGVLSALKKDSFFDKLTTIISVFGMSLPSFFAAILIAWIFAFLLRDFTGLNMTGSLFTVDDYGRGEYLSLKNLILPAFTLGIRPLAIVAELSRSSMLDVLSQDYIRTAKSNGLGKTRILIKHALKNALNPVITAVSGWFASLMAGAVFVEFVFDWKGVGVVIVQSLEKYDFPVIMGAVILVSVMLVLINIVVDIIYAALDPRIRLA